MKVITNFISLLANHPSTGVSIPKNKWGMDKYSGDIKFTLLPGFLMSQFFSCSLSLLCCLELYPSDTIKQRKAEVKLEAVVASFFT